MPLNIKTIQLGPISANCYILTDSETGISAVIDPGEWNNELETLIDGLKIEYILLTHGHFDHILGAAALKEYTGAKVAVHKEDADCLKDEHKSLCAWEMPDTQKALSADVLLSDGDLISIGNSTLKVMHTPGHTRGGVCYIGESDRVIFSGDTLFCLTAGRTDFPGSSTEALFDSLKKLKNLDGDFTVYTGHNRSTTLSYERIYNRYMRNLG